MTDVQRTRLRQSVSSSLPDLDKLPPDAFGVPVSPAFLQQQPIGYRATHKELINTGNQMVELPLAAATDVHPRIINRFISSGSSRPEDTAYLAVLHALTMLSTSCLKDVWRIGQTEWTAASTTRK